MKKSEGSIKYIVKNKKAYHDYCILEKLEAGIVLQGTEAKSMRESKVSLVDSYCKVQDSELFLVNLNIAQYDRGGYTNHVPTRKRKLLVHRKEIIRLRNKLILKGYTLIPLSIYFKRGWAKLELGLAKGRQKEDQREHLKAKDAKKEMRAHLGQR